MRVDTHVFLLCFKLAHFNDDAKKKKKKKSLMVVPLLNVTLSDFASINFSGYMNAP